MKNVAAFDLTLGGSKRFESLSKRSDINFRYFYIFEIGEATHDMTTRKIIFPTKIQADFFFVCSDRVVEYILTALSDSKIIFIQHAYIDERIVNIQRISFSNIRKTLLYLFWLILFVFRKPKLCIAAVINFLLGKNIAFYKKIDRILSFDSHSAEKIKRKHSINNTPVDLIPIVENKKFYEKINKYHYQYVASTAVEDGKLDVKHWANKINAILFELKIEKLMILCHPRTDITNYKYLNVTCEFFWDKFFSGPVIGHFSTFLLYLKWSGLRVMLLEIDELTIPKDFTAIMNAPYTEFKTKFRFVSSYSDLSLYKYVQ